MPRPNKGTDLRLLQAGKTLLLEKGIDALTVNAVCKLAKVNQGMFVYNFKSKEEFMNKLLDELFEEIMNTIGLDDITGKKPVEKIEIGMVYCCKAARKYPRLLQQFINDSVVGDDETLMRVFLERGQKELHRLFRHFVPAQQDGDISKNITLPEFILLFWPPLIYSCTSIMQIMEMTPPKYRQPEELYTTEEAIRKRVHRCLRMFHPSVYDNL